MDDRPVILQVQHLTTRFRIDGAVLTAVDDVSFEVHAGETLGIVGESGCGKTVASKSIMRLLPERTATISPTTRILFTPRFRPGERRLPHDTTLDLATADERTLRRVRGARLAMIFQEPMTSLNPVFTVGWQITEALKYHTTLTRRERHQRALEMLRLVEIPEPERRLREYPHQLSGGMRQRVMIAIALCCEPDVLIADEPTTALDVTVQAQILDLMKSLQQRLGTAIILITHNLGVVAQFCERVLVMYAGRVVEQGSVRDLFHRPRHPYTRALLDSLPGAGPSRRRLTVIEGMVPNMIDIPPGCRFADRCRLVQPRCREREPGLTATEDGRLVRCYYPLSEPRTPPPMRAGVARPEPGEAT